MHWYWKLAARAIALILLAFSTAFAQPPTIGKCTVLPADNIWNTPVDQLTVSPSSSAWVNTIGATKTVHADFGSGLWDGGPIGIPYITVPGTQAKFPATFDYADESDRGPYAIPLTAPIEGGSQSTGDRHTFAIDTDNCILYELYYAFPKAASWTAGSGAIFNLLSNALRPSGWTSTDAAGLPVFPGLVRYDEIAAGEIRHAIRFTVPQTRNTFLWPARHYASSLSGSQYPPMGARFRLRASFDISGYSAANQVILRALKKYGMMLADNGSAWYISGAPDDRWNNDDLHKLGLLKGSDFEAVDVSGLMVDPNSGQAKQSTTVSVVVSPSTAAVAVNATRQFTATVTNATTQVVDWSVNGAPGGNSTFGLINTSGLYTAPAVPPAGGTVTVQAASVASPSAIGTATVTVTQPAVAPVLTAISPNSGTQGASVAVTLTGSNFLSGATVAIAGTGVAASGVNVASSTQITATFAIAAAATTGTHSVTVTTSAGTSSAVPFTVNASAPPQPTLTSLTPNSGTQGASVAVTLTGTNFLTGASVAIGGAGVTAAGVVVASSTRISATFAISSSAATGVHSVTVTTTGGTTAAVPFTVNAPAPVPPTLSFLMPNSGTQGTTVPVTLSGSNFLPGATVMIGGSGVTATGVAVVSSTQISATFAISPTAATGVHSVTVTTTAGTTAAVPFTVNAPAPLKPTLSSLSPNSGVQGTNVAVTLAGMNFQPGATVAISGTGVTATGVSVTGSTQIAATFVISSTAGTGVHSVTVTTSAGTSAAVAFTVNAPVTSKPVLSSITPNSAARGASVKVTLVGTNFTSPASVHMEGRSVSVTNVTVVNSTTITATLHVSRSARHGGRNTMVTTKSGTSNSLPFTVK